MLNPDTGRPSSVSRRLKRLLDVTLAASGLIASSPFLLLIAVLIRLRMGRPVLYRQVRPGLHGEPFTLVKFRTMRHPRPGEAEVGNARARVTRLGSFLRRSSLDEVPELWNVLRGDMSIVGPRPLLTEFLQYYTDEQRRRHDVLPGMTGWAQIHGRREVQMQERIDLDIWYVDNWSLRLDARIILATIRQILSGSSESEPVKPVPFDQLGWAGTTEPSEGSGAPGKPEAAR